MSSKPTSEQKMLEFKHIIAHYGKVEVLCDVSIAVDEGMIIALIGANGSGKSTVLRLISGLMKPTSGSILFQQNRIDGMTPYNIKRLGVVHVPEGRRLFGKMTVEENLEIGRYTQKGDKKTVDVMEKVFQRFPVLKEREKQKARFLSGGEQQILAIARGLMSEPKLLLLDEPTLGLSPLMSKEIGNLIADINREGVAVILAEQNARLALRLSKEAYVLDAGRLTLKGKTEELVHNEEIVKAYLSA